MIKVVWKKYNLSFGIGFGKVVGKVFWIGYFGYVDEVCWDMFCWIVFSFCFDWKWIFFFKFFFWMVCIVIIVWCFSGCWVCFDGCWIFCYIRKWCSCSVSNFVMVNFFYCFLILNIRYWFNFCGWWLYWYYWVIVEVLILDWIMEGVDFSSDLKYFVCLYYFYFGKMCRKLIVFCKLKVLSID